MSFGDLFFFFFNDTATTEIYTLSLHDALPIFFSSRVVMPLSRTRATCSSATSMISRVDAVLVKVEMAKMPAALIVSKRSEEHTSELQSRQYLVCRLLLEKKKKKMKYCSYT